MVRTDPRNDPTAIRSDVDIVRRMYSVTCPNCGNTISVPAGPHKSVHRCKPDALNPTLNDAPYSQGASGPQDEGGLRTSAPSNEGDGSVV
jgi:hypothetical protein